MFTIFQLKIICTNCKQNVLIMFKNFFILSIIVSFGAFLYGIRNIFIEVEDNACRMTYMFGIPQFSVSIKLHNY